jgi:hypothetical protein
MEERRGIVDRRALKRKSRVSLGATALAGGDEEPNEGGMGQKEMPSWLSDTLAVSSSFALIRSIRALNRIRRSSSTEMGKPNLSSFETSLTNSNSFSRGNFRNYTIYLLPSTSVEHKSSCIANLSFDETFYLAIIEI